MAWRTASSLNHRRLYHCSPGLIIAESEWRAAAEQHMSQVRNLLSPGFLASQELSTRGRSNKRKEDQESGGSLWLPLDPKHPVFNFLIEYYGLKGAKGTRRLALWSPDFTALPNSSSGQSFSSSGAGVALRGATERDLGCLLHRRAAVVDASIGVLYDPFQHFSDKKCSLDSMDAVRLAGPFLWYHRILERTLQAEPVLHCYGLHEWAMQYRPRGAPPPPSAKYQAHLPLRCDQELINAVVEGDGRGTRLSCTHFDALRFFAPAASPLNAFGSIDTLQRGDQLRIEQPACIHSQMDVLKIALKLQPFGDPSLVLRALELALQARRLDVAASPYDASMYGVDPICIETAEGRGQYRQEQLQLTLQARSIRTDLLSAYSSFLEFAFTPDDLQKAVDAFDHTWQTKQERTIRSRESASFG
jgi:hypothetical protein